VELVEPSLLEARWRLRSDHSVQWLEDFLGAFAIVVAHEMYLRRNFLEALRAGWGTLLGRMAGMVLKLVISMAMIMAVAAALLF
jgi:uncharacterized protein YqgC (DUF456 family)